MAQEGRTIVFATHHLQEADQTADRVVVINHGQVVADGPGAALKASVAARKVRFRWRQPDRALIDRLDGATDIEVRGEMVTVDTFDPDTTVRALCAGKVPFEDLEVSGAGIEEAFVALTRTRPASPARPTSPARPARAARPGRSGPPRGSAR
jgi:ABC-2 type transport system ATP-binding protein